jgi:hypothetical protein
MGAEGDRETPDLTVAIDVAEGSFTFAVQKWQGHTLDVLPAVNFDPDVGTLSDGDARRDGGK